MITKVVSKKITFIPFQRTVAKEYNPQPASRFIPDWYKKTPPWSNKKNHPTGSPTIKKCLPVLDAITAGYIIVSPCDVYVTIEDSEPKYSTPSDQFIIEHHPRKQAHLHPKANDFQFPKWINPWSIKTPKGYSLLFVAPLHNPNPWFEIMPGIVDTDNYSNPVNFPFVLKNPMQECLIPAGTPIVQIIPIKRDNWIHEFSQDMKEQENIHKVIHSLFFNRYKKLFWTRKSYE